MTPFNFSLLYFMLIQQNIDRNKEIYPICIFEGFIGKEVFMSKMVSLSMMSEYLCLSKYKPIFMSSYFPSFL